MEIFGEEVIYPERCECTKKNEGIESLSREWQKTRKGRGRQEICVKNRTGRSLELFFISPADCQPNREPRI